MFNITDQTITNNGDFVTEGNCSSSSDLPTSSDIELYKMAVGSLFIAVDTKTGYMLQEDGTWA